MRRARQVLFDGLAIGAIGFLSIALWFAVINVVAGRSPFHTAALFGGALFYGLEDPTLVDVAPGPVAAFNAVHALAFLAIGLFAAWFVMLGERYPVAQYLLFAVLLLLGFHLFAGVVVFALPLLGPATWWQIGLASAIAGALALWYILRSHPILRREMHDFPWDAAPDEVEPAAATSPEPVPISPVLSSADLDALEARADHLDADDLRRLFESHRALQASIDRAAR